MRSARILLVLVAFVVAPLAGLAGDPKKPAPRPQQPTATAPMARPEAVAPPRAPAVATRAPAPMPRPSAAPSPLAPVQRAPDPVRPTPAPRAPTATAPRAPVTDRPAAAVPLRPEPREVPVAEPRRIEPKIIPLPGAERAVPTGEVRDPGRLDVPGADRRIPEQSTGRVPVPSDFDISRPSGTVRDFGGGERLPPVRPDDPRHSRPHHDYVSPPPGGPYAPPGYYWYRPWYTHWYCHPYWRYTHATWAVVWFGFDVYPYDPWWTPPYRTGWVWVPGYWDWGWWVPGYWVPVAPAPVRYVYVGGHWSGEAYVEGYYRRDARDGWDWVDGYYLDDGTYVQGHWVPDHPGPEGYTWEPGFWDGETWIEGFWRPEFRDGYKWVSSFYDEEGVYNAGYWLPLEERPGHAWIPGWFDGKRWNDGYWVEEAELEDAAIDEWVPPEGHDAGAHDDDVPTVTPPDELPLALPVE